ncbi:MAG: cytochrome c [Gammaproteobacteria bacterium]|nr:cytochrome c [Gammaproteobacteria bacterium]
MKRYCLLILFAVAAMSGCSKTNSYTPEEGASGEDIFKSVCIDCHASENGYIFELPARVANSVALADKIQKGSIAMPSFPNIQDDAMERLAQYIIADSKTVE